MLTNEQILAVAESIREDHNLTFDDGHVVTDVCLIVRARDPERLWLSCLSTVATRHTDFISLSGMLRFAQLVNEGDGGDGRD
jgi:hypothetical protein